MVHGYTGETALFCLNLCADFTIESIVDGVKYLWYLHLSGIAWIGTIV